MCTIRPAAIGLRTKRTQQRAGRSPVKRPWPRTRAGSSTRRIERPTQRVPLSVFDPTLIECRRLFRAAQVGRRAAHRLDDVLVAGAAAEIGREEIEDLLVADVGLGLER